MPEKTPSPFPVKLSQPALRALANAGITSLKQLSKWSEKEILQLHGIRPGAFEALKKALKNVGLSFAG